MLIEVLAAITVLSPADGAATTSRTIHISARIDGEWRGPVRATCDDRRAFVRNGRIRCTVALGVGVNAVEVRAVSVGADFASALLRISRKTTRGVSIIPSEVVVDTKAVRAAGDMVTAVTASGDRATDVRWAVSGHGIVTLAGDASDALITAKSPGRAVVTARSAGRVARGGVTVVDRVSLTEKIPFGMRVWAVGPVAGLLQRPPLNAELVQPPEGNDAMRIDGCDLFAVDADPAGGFTVVRGLRNNGGLVWVGTIPGTPLFGDTYGGLLALVGRMGRPSSVLGRFDRVDARSGVWRFHANGTIDDVTQSGDGTIYAVENLGHRKRIVVLDGRDGTVRARLPLAAGAVLGPIGGLEGDSALAQVRDARGLSLVRVTPTAIETVAPLADVDVRPHAAPGPAVRLPNGQAVAVWADGATLHASLVIGSSIAADYATRSEVRRPQRTWHVLVEWTDDGSEAPWVFVGDGSALEAIDLLHRERRWRVPSAGVPFDAFYPHEIAVNDESRHRLIAFDERGRDRLLANANITSARIIIHNSGIVHGFDPLSRSVVEIRHPGQAESEWVAVFSFTAGGVRHR